MQRRMKGIGAWFFIMIIFLFIYSAVSSLGMQDTRKSYSDFILALHQEQVNQIDISDNHVQFTLKNETKKVYTAQIPSKEILQADVGAEIQRQIQENKLSYSAEKPKISWMSIIGPVLILIAIGAFWFFIFQQQSGQRPNAFTKSRAKLSSDEKHRIGFSDVAGAVEEKEELFELVDFLKNPQRFIALGARIPKGVLLVGPPGTGKTLLARAVAGEANVPFFSISGSDFVELYVGVGASRVRDLFEQAKKSRPCIIFIDEIDAVGRKRGAGMGGGHDEREQTLNQLLVEMDGFGVNEGIIMIAATNRPDILDPALLRPGRFDRQIVVAVPDVSGREEILKVHSRKKPFADEVNLSRIAKVTPGYTGADLENLLNEAAIFAARRGKSKIDNQDLEDANMKVMMGTERKSRVITEKERILTAYHEAGHALLTRLLDKSSKIHQVSIIPRGRAGGYTMNMPAEDHNYSTKKEMLREIVILLGGRVAEGLKLSDISTGASNDLKRATDLARSMVTQYGMSSRLGPICYDSDEEVFLGRDFAHAKDYSEKIAAEIDEEISSIISQQYKEAEKLLSAHDEMLEKIAAALLEKETINESEFDALFA